MSSQENDNNQIACDGGDDNSKHPLVYLKTNDKGTITCPYCGKKFSKKHD